MPNYCRSCSKITEVVRTLPRSSEVYRRHVFSIICRIKNNEILFKQNKIVYCSEMNEIKYK